MDNAAHIGGFVAGYLLARVLRTGHFLHMLRGWARWRGPVVAMALAAVTVLIEEDLYDKDYVERYTVGFEQLRDHVRSYSPEWVYLETGIRPEVIRETARAMANAAPATIVHPGRHATWYGDDTQRSRAIAMLNALLGSKVLPVKVNPCTAILTELVHADEPTVEVRYEVGQGISERDLAAVAVERLP